ncbi:MAG: histidine--tRNA ligase [Candidatus Micrarchaeota archaeon]
MDDSGEGVRSDENVFQPVRGFRDFLGGDKRLRDGVKSRLVACFEKYGFQPLQTPAVESFSVLAAKFAGGEEILGETYRLSDRGGRELALRYDLTVPLCRFVAGNPKLAMPFKRYAVGSVWRDGPLKAGRYREFEQCDVDTVGAQGMAADAEVLALGCEALASLGLEFEYSVNNRKLLDGVLLQAGVPQALLQTAILSLDKLEKTGAEAVLAEMRGKGVPEAACRDALKAISLSSDDRNAFLDAASGGNELARQGARELSELYAFLGEFGCAGKVRFSPSLARGLSYYTGTVFEAFLAGDGRKKISSSISGGGRYDGIVGSFVTQATGRQQAIPAVGVSFGLDVICECIKRGLGSVPAGAGTSSGVFVIPIAGEKSALRLAGELRKRGVACGVDLMERGVTRNIEYAVKQGYSYALIVGPREAAAGSATVRNLNSGEEKSLPQAEALKLLEGKCA